MRYEAEHLLLPDGWASPGWIEVADDGTIAATGAGRAEQPDEQVAGYALPGMANVHSHAHQRGLVGWADRFSAKGAETLWSWRERMYDLVLRISPEDLEALAAQAYVEMLKRGFTAVGEFHYVHNDETGRPYSQHTELSDRIAAASRRTGIALTLLPALYTSAGVGRPPSDEQRRFVMAPDEYVDLIGELSRNEDIVVGIAPHSLRAVQAAELKEVVAALPEGPAHIHVAERTEEVEEIHAGLGTTPVRWLLDNVDVSERWTLIHATHGTPNELSEVASASAVVGLCPLTEANLADGRFPLPEYSSAGGRWGIGSDANHLIDLAGELRTLEYGQRLAHHRRNTLLAGGESSVGTALFVRALAGGAQALARPMGALRTGLRADLVVLDPDEAAFAGQAPETVLDAWVFSTSSTTVVKNVMVGGRWVVVDGHHQEEGKILTAFRETMRRLHG